MGVRGKANRQATNHAPSISAAWRLRFNERVLEEAEDSRLLDFAHMEEESRAEVPRISAPPTGTLPLEVFFMDSLTPFIRHELEDRPGVSAAPEASCSRCSPPLGKEPDPVQPPSPPDGPDVQLPPPEIPPNEPSGVPMTDGTPVACRQKNAAAFLKGQVPGVMAEYAPGLFSTEQRLHSRQPAPDDSEGVQDLVDWREDAPYG